MNKRWDIFCHVVDNYGDAGVCWRLAHQLAAEFDFSVRLWIDDLSVLKKIRSEIVPHQREQICAGVNVCQWAQSLPQPLLAADVVIEAFACELPSEYRAAMHAQRSCWINLEYLSAEDWVSGCHGLPSQVDSVLKKYFFFPGFQRNTGGVLGERDLSQRRREFQSSLRWREELLRPFTSFALENATLISLFAYRYAPIEPLLGVWSTQSSPVICFVPEGQPLAAVSHFWGEDLPVGAERTMGSLSVVVVPFLSQGDYDRLLWSCDINFVRGEDSFVRAQWAAKPFTWQIYAQTDGAHWSKLEAFLDLYCAELPPSAADALRNFWLAWNGNNEGSDLAVVWQRYTEAQAALRTAANNWAERLESGTNLAVALVQFCANQV